MEFRNIDNWKTIIKKVAAKNNVSVVDVQQRFILEEFASKIGKSEYRNSLMLKGEFVVSNLLGINNRTTRDIDLTFHSTIYSEQEIKDILNNVLSVDDNSFFYYELASLRMAQVDDHYSGFTASINAVHGKMKLTLKLDISNNTLIYPGVVSNFFESMFDNECINIMSYQIENIIAEKI